MEKYNQFNIFRFIGAFAVVITHIGRNTSLYSDAPTIFKFGTMWVYFFLILSGFMSSYTYYNRPLNIKKFYLTKFFKLYPVYFFSILLTFLEGFRHKEKIIYNIFLIQSWIFGKAFQYNISAWYLSVFIFLMILFPFLLKLQKLFPKFFLYITIFINLYMYYVYFFLSKFSDIPYIEQLINYYPIFHIPSFCMGMALFQLVKKYKATPYFSALAFSYFLLFIMFVQYNRIIPYFYNLIAFSFAPLIIFLFLDNGIFSRILGNKLFVFLGNLSFSIYIIHMPIREVYEKYIHKIDNNYNFFTCFLLIFTISIFTKYFIENKFFSILSSKFLKY